MKKLLCLVLLAAPLCLQATGTADVSISNIPPEVTVQQDREYKANDLVLIPRTDKSIYTWGIIFLKTSQGKYRVLLLPDFQIVKLVNPEHILSFPLPD